MSCSTKWPKRIKKGVFNNLNREIKIVVANIIIIYRITRTETIMKICELKQDYPSLKILLWTKNGLPHRQILKLPVKIISNILFILQWHGYQLSAVLAI